MEKDEQWNRGTPDLACRSSGHRLAPAAMTAEASMGAISSV